MIRDRARGHEPPREQVVAVLRKKENARLGRERVPAPFARRSFRIEAERRRRLHDDGFKLASSPSHARRVFRKPVVMEHDKQRNSCAQNVLDMKQRLPVVTREVGRIGINVVEELPEPKKLFLRESRFHVEALGI